MYLSPPAPIQPFDTGQVNAGGLIAIQQAPPTNFAGHFRLAVFPAGLPVGVRFALIDAVDGAVRFPPIDAMLGVSNRVESELLVVDGPEWYRSFCHTKPDASALCSVGETVYYRWTGAQLVALDSVPWQADSGQR